MGKKLPKIRFECGRCGKRWTVPGEKIGKVVACTCGRSVIVPAQSMRGESFWDMLIGRIVYAFGGAVIGLIGSTLFAFSFVLVPWRYRILGILGFSIGCFFLGLFVGERFINWLGRTVEPE